MTRSMLIDAAHPEETRIAVVNQRRLENFDYEAAARTTLKGNIYLGKIARVEASLQAAFVEYGGNRHGFLPFADIHPDYYRLPQEDRQALIEEEAAARRESDLEGGDVEDDDADEAEARPMAATTRRKTGAGPAGCAGNTRSRRSSSAARSCWCRSPRKSAAPRARRSPPICPSPGGIAC